MCSRNHEILQSDRLARFRSVSESPELSASEQELVELVFDEVTNLAAQGLDLRKGSCRLTLRVVHGELRSLTISLRIGTKALRAMERRARTESVRAR
jgi:hypothetical protein